MTSSRLVCVAVVVGIQLAMLSVARPARAQEATISSTAPHPVAGAWLFDLRVPVTFTLSDPGPDVPMYGVALGVGQRVTDRWYLGGTAELNGEMNVGATPGMINVVRVGGEARYIFHEGTAQVSVNDGPYYPVPRYDWLGVRAGAESLQPFRPTGGFAELSLGTDAWISQSFQFGMVFAAGLSVEPAGEYAVASATPNSAVGSTSSSIVSPYFTLAFHFGLGG